MRVDDDQLRFDAPAGVMTPELRSTLRDRKGELLVYLRQLRVEDEGAPALRPMSRETPLPVSFGQRRLWFLQQLTLESGLYNLPGALRLTGSLDAAALQRSLSEIQRRHEVLRTTFTLQDGEPVQCVGEAVDLPLAITDLSALDPNERMTRLAALMGPWSRQPFDLANGPVLRAQLVCMHAAEHVLLLAFHHIVCDGWSIGVFVRELTALYEAFAAGRPSPLAPLAIQYADFAVWQRARLTGPAFQRQLAYWREQLAGPLPVLELPTDHPRPAVQTFNGRLHWFTVPAPTAAGLESLSRARGVTLFMTLLAAFDVLLYRRSGQCDLVVGSPVANRTASELEPLLGFFVNSVALRTRVEPGASFVDLLARVKDTCLGAFEHQEIPVETLVEVVRPDRETSHTPLYQVMFALQTAPGGRLQLPGLTIDALELEALTSKFDITLSMKQTVDGLVGVIEYNTDLFERSTVERMAAAFCTLLRGVVAAPETRVDALPLVSAGERGALVAAGTGPAGGAPAGATMAGLLAAQMGARPGAVALEAGGATWTYAALGAAAGQVAGALRAAGVGPNVPVGIWLPREAGLLITVAGIVGAGGGYVALEPTQPRARAARMWGETGVRVVVTDAAAVAAGTVPAGPWTVLPLESVLASRDARRAEAGGVRRLSRSRRLPLRRWPRFCPIRRRGGVG